MAFTDIPNVESFQTYLDIAFNNGKKAATSARQLKIDDKLRKSRHIERARIEAMGKSLISSLDMLLSRFPQIDDLAPFYLELIKATLDYDKFKQSLGALTWAKQQIKHVLAQTKQHLKATEGNMAPIRRSFSGRASSILKQIAEHFDYLEQCRKKLRSFPSLKTGRKTIVIAGAPNVGKSTLLALLTGSNPDTASYPFTTKELNLGYDPNGNQYIDTPGLLDRPLEERNTIELHGILALKYLATLIVFIIDPTENCGYTLKQQEHILSDIKQRFPQPVLIVSNKADTGQVYDKALAVSAKTQEGIAALKEQINEALAQMQDKTAPPA